MTANSLILGTRGSDLALAQASLVRAALTDAVPGMEVEVRVIRTTGDKRLDLRLADPSAIEPGAKIERGLFTRELESALAEGTIDIAVHSLKDLPTTLQDGFGLAAVLPRAATHDVIVFKSPGASLDSLAAAGAAVATSSTRRARLLQWRHPGLAVSEIRGNVPTRIRKLAGNPDLDALVLARAGMERLGMDPGSGEIECEGRRLPVEILPLDLFPPAPGQGAIAIECLDVSPDLADALSRINHQPTFQAVTAERAFLRHLDGGCQSPVGIRSTFPDIDTLRLDAIVFDAPAPAPPLEGWIEGDALAPEALAASLLDRLETKNRCK